jgi:hypothetical protein
MRECGANVTPIQTFLGHLRAGLSVEQALEKSAVPPGAGAFVRATMAIARSAEPHRVAAAFAYGREEIIPAMFRRLVDQLAELSPQSWGTLRYYLDRHILTDADRHGPKLAYSCEGSVGTTPCDGPRRRRRRGLRLKPGTSFGTRLCLLLLQT